MKKDNFLPALAFLLFSAFLATLGCAKPNIQQPIPLPPIVKEYKHVSVLGGTPGMKNTGIYLKEGEVFSILATGSINYWGRRLTSYPGSQPPPDFKYHDVRPELGWPLLVRVGEDFAFSPFYNKNATNLIFQRSGNIYLGYRSGPISSSGTPLRPQEYKDDTGSFNIDIIVWKEADWIQIADFFSQVALKNPDNKAVADAHRDADKYAKIALAEKQAKEEIAKTQQQISSLKKEDESTGKPEAQPLPGQLPTQVVSKGDKIAQLQARLTKLLESQVQLEEVKKNWRRKKRKQAFWLKNSVKKQKENRSCYPSYLKVLEIRQSS